MLVRPAFILAAAAALAAAAPASAQTVLLDDTFNGENGGAGAGVYSGFANFIAADVDLLAPGFFFSLCQSAGGSTPCVDMEGNGNGSLTTRTAYDLAPGSVTIQFDLAGDQRGGRENTVTASLVGTLGTVFFREVFSLASPADFTTFTRTVVLPEATTARLSFVSGGAADSYGMLLDNVVLTAGAATPPPVTTPVPEPSSLFLLGGGFALMGSLVRRRRPRA
jgi:PEP-CTERM motif-containing protein